jgi:hypothetical protein
MTVPGAEQMRKLVFVAAVAIAVAVAVLLFRHAA